MKHMQVFAVWAFKGDMEYLANYLNLEHFGAHVMCPWCEACYLEPDHPLVESGVYGFIPWNDFRWTAKWRTTSWNRHPVASWLASHADRHPIFYVPGVTIHTIMPDHLHICDLGVFQRIIGNLLFCMVFNRLVPGDDVASRVQSAWFLVEQEYANLGIPASRKISGLRLPMFCNDKKIHGAQPGLRGLKAAETRDMMPPVVAAFEKLAMTFDSVENRLAVECGRQACGYLDIMKNIEGPVMTEAEASDIQSCVYRMLMCYSALNSISVSRGLKRWGATPKFHYLCHLADMCSYSAPRANWTYMDEDFMGIMRTLVQACCTGGAAYVDVQLKTAKKWALGYELSCEFRDL